MNERLINKVKNLPRIYLLDYFYFFIVILIPWHNVLNNQFAVKTSQYEYKTNHADFDYDGSVGI